MQNYVNSGAGASPRSVMPEKPLTPYEDRVIPTLRNNNKSRQDKSLGGAGADYYSSAADDEQLNNSGSNNSQDQGAGPDSIVPEQQPPVEFEQEMYDPMDGTEEMTEREVREAALMNDYLGKQIVKKKKKHIKINIAVLNVYILYI